MFVQEKVLRGITSLLILRVLLKGPAHGYALEKEISLDLERGLPGGEIYVLLKNLERKKLVQRVGTVKVRGRQVTQYKMTNEGIEFLKRHVEPLEVVDRILHGLLEDIKGIQSL